MSCLSWFIVLPSVMIGHLAMCHYWIYWFNLINPILWFNLISSILWSDLISLIYWLDLIILTQLLLPSPTHWRRWKALPIILHRIWLGRPRPHTKYTGMVYYYIPDNFGSSNPGWPHMKVYPKLELVSLLSISCVEVIMLCICTVVQRATV